MLMVWDCMRRSKAMIGPPRRPCSISTRYAMGAMPGKAKSAWSGGSFESARWK